jgi:hypothetical protein
MPLLPPPYKIGSVWTLAQLCEEFFTVDVPGNGLCFWASVLVSRKGRQRGGWVSSPALLQFAAEMLQRQVYRELCPNGRPTQDAMHRGGDEHAVRMCAHAARVSASDPDSWADDLMIQAYCEKKRGVVFIFEQMGPEGPFRVTFKGPTSTEGGQKLNVSLSHCAYVVRSLEEHYSALIQRRADAAQTPGRCVPLVPRPASFGSLLCEPSSPPSHPSSYTLEDLFAILRAQGRTLQHMREFKVHPLIPL